MSKNSITNHTDFISVRRLQKFLGIATFHILRNKRVYLLRCINVYSHKLCFCYTKYLSFVYEENCVGIRGACWSNTN